MTESSILVVELELERISQLDLARVVHNELIVGQGIAVGIIDACRLTGPERNLHHMHAMG